MTPLSFTRFESRFVSSADGTQIYADAAGNRSPHFPVIVMIHGLCVVKAAFDSMFEDLQWTSNAFLVRYDVRGHGRSGKPINDEAWESQRMSEDFEAVCKEFEVTKAFVMGWSLGAAHFVDIVNYNTSVAISGFICSSGLMHIEPAVLMRIAAPQSLGLLADLTQTTDVDAFQQAALTFISWLSDHLSPELSRALLEGVLLVPKNIAGKLATRTQNPEKILREGQRGKLELLVLACGKDAFVDVKGYKAVFEESGWKDYTLRDIAEADHMPWLSRPDDFREIVMEWVKERHCCS